MGSVWVVVLGVALLAGLAWGTYVPVIFYGGKELGGTEGARLTSILCVGLAWALCVAKILSDVRIGSSSRLLGGRSWRSGHGAAIGSLKQSNRTDAAIL